MDTARSTVLARPLSRAAGLLLGLASLPAVTAEPPGKEAGFIEEGPEEGIPGVVRLSSGEVLRGAVTFTDGKRLRAYDLREKKTFEIELSRIESIRTLVESESIEDAWAFEEEGSRKKVKLGWRYPTRAYRQEIQLRGGQVVEGHCHAAALYVDDGKTERKVVLFRSQKGGKGQTLEDLVYPAVVDLGQPSGRTGVGGAAAAARPFARLEGVVPGLSAAAVVDRGALRGAPCKVSASGALSVDGLLPGEYLVFLRAGDEVITGFPPAPSLGPDDEASISKRVAGIAEFFDEKRIVSSIGGADSPWILLQLDREGGTTLTGAGGESYGFRRWEVWCLKRRAGEWKIDARIFLDRMAVPPGKALGPARYRSDPALERLRLGEGPNSLAAPAGPPARGRPEPRRKDTERREATR